MTELAELRRMAQAARQVEHVEGASRFVLLAPTRHEIRATVARLGLGMPVGELQVRAARALVAAALTEWEGVRECDVAPGAPEDPLPLSVGAAELLFDARPDLYATLSDLAFRHGESRAAAAEAEAGN